MTSFFFWFKIALIVYCVRDGVSLMRYSSEEQKRVGIAAGIFHLILAAYLCCTLT